MKYRSVLFSAALGIFALTGASAQDTGYVKAHGKPGDAGVFINGQYAGPATRFTVPEKYPAPAGEIEVTFRDPRYEDFTTKITVRAKKTTKIKYSMKKLPEPKPPFGRFRLGGGEPESFISIAAGDTGAVYINDGAAEFSATMTVTNPLSSPLTGTFRRLTIIGGDGQVGTSDEPSLRVTDETTSVGATTSTLTQIAGPGTTVSYGDSDSDWNGSDWGPLNQLWDTHTASWAAGPLPAGTSGSYVTQFVSHGDCIVWQANVLTANTGTVP